MFSEIDFESNEKYGMVLDFMNFHEMDEQRFAMQAINKMNEDGFLMTGKRKSACVVTYGCQQNKNDSEKILGLLLEMGYEVAKSEETCDLLIFNTCAVREKAEAKVFSKVGAACRLKEKNNTVIGITGCMVHEEHVVDKIKKVFKHVDFILGTNSIHLLPSSILKTQTTRSLEVSPNRIVENVPTKRGPPPIASVSIMYGCDNFCTYCIVPYTRGREQSRRPEDVISEIQNLAGLGYKEINLLGQNVNSYGKNLDQPLTFARLLDEVSKVSGVERIRFITSHPKDISAELIDVIANNNKVCNQLHLPVQSGSNLVLKKMNRRYTREQYLDLILHVKSKIPDILLTTDIIVGFPGETDFEFEETMKLLAEIEFDSVFSFIYSERKGTPAASMEEKVSAADKKKNFNRLLELQREISFRKNKEYIGRKEVVLVEGVSKTNSEIFQGRTFGGKIVNFPGDIELVGNFIDVNIIDAKTWYLIGELD